MCRTRAGGRKGAHQRTSLRAVGGALRVAVFVRLPRGLGRALPHLTGRWRGWFTVSRCPSRKGAPTSPRAPSRWDPGSGGKPGQPRREREEGRPGRRERGRLQQESRPLQTSSDVPSRAGGRSPDPRLRSRGGTRPGHWETDRVPVVPAPQRVGSGTPAGAAERISAGPAAHHRPQGQGPLSRPAPGCGRKTEPQPPLQAVSEFPCAKSGRLQVPPHSHLGPSRLCPRAPDLLGRSRGSSRETHIGSLQPGIFRGVLPRSGVLSPDQNETHRVSTEMGPERVSPSLESHSFRLWRQWLSPASSKAWPWTLGTAQVPALQAPRERLGREE